MRYRPGFFIIALGVILLILVACGKKASPSLPERVMPLRVAKLEAGLEKGTVVLKGSVIGPEGKGRVSGDVMGCRVYHARYDTGDTPCETCPIEYDGFKLIKGEVITGEGFYCQVPGEASTGTHFFEVRLIGADGAVGSLSNRAKLTIYD
ncbi:MAG: hypothetical protein V1689_14345 [Pseudomonadota bacterium]